VLGIEEPHPLITSLWETVQTSCEATFYSETDWQRLRLELWYTNQAMSSGKPLYGHTWGAIQHGLNELLPHRTTSAHWPDDASTWASGLDRAW
jgi:hypothetical protein